MRSNQQFQPDVPAFGGDVAELGRWAFAKRKKRKGIL